MAAKLPNSISGGDATSSTDEMVTHYAKKVNQRKLAKVAIDKLVGAGNGNKK